MKPGFKLCSSRENVCLLLPAVWGHCQPQKKKKILLKFLGKLTEFSMQTYLNVSGYKVSATIFC